MRTHDARRWVPRVGVAAGACLAAIACRSGGQAAPQPPLPEGDQGLAARYAGDDGIENDPAVLFVERFDEPSVADMNKRWESADHAENTSLVNDYVPGSVDTHSLLITHTGGRDTGASLYRRLPPGQKVVFARWYVKFHSDCAKVHHFGTCLGGYNPATRWPQGGAGERPEGNARFTANLEPYGDDWMWDFYTYWQGMHVHGDGRYWGTPLLSGVPRHPVEKDKWVCTEVMLKLNDPPEARNGELAFWIDGKLWRVDGQVVSHLGPGYPTGKWTGGWWHPDAQSQAGFEGFAWRSVQDFDINFLWTYLYITDAPQGHVSHVGFDNIVVAKSYVGPLAPK